MKFPRMRADKNKTPTNQPKHTQQAPNKKPHPGKFAKLVRQVKQMRPSQPLKSSLPTCSTPPSHPLFRCRPCLHQLSFILRRVSDVWLQPTSLELISALSSLPPLRTMLHKSIYIRMSFCLLASQGLKKVLEF